MRRRQRSNPLLAKTVGIGIVVAAAVLPILAQLGLFKQMHEEYVQTQLINLPPPPPQPKEARPKAHKAVRPHEEGHHGAKITRATVQVHVQAGSGGKGSGDHGVEIVNAKPGGQIGVIPTGPPAPPATAPPPPPAPTPSPQLKPAPAPIPPPPPPPPAPAADVIAEAEPTYQPEPVIPDDLLDSDLDTTFYGYFTIHTDGAADVKMVQGTGNSILDRLAMDAAKQWKFTPATKNGVPVESYRRLQVEFVVSDNS